MRARLLVGGLIAVIASLLLAASASATGGSIAVVTTNTDNGSLTGCELRDAILAVTNDIDVHGCVITSPGGDDQVNFAPAMSGQTITLNGAEIGINDPDDLFINGPGMNQLTVSGNDASRVFNAQTILAITGMSLVHGLAPPTGGISEGGAINSTASGPFSLFLTDVKVANSAAVEPAATGTAFADGGAIHSQNGRLILDQSVITQNTATATGTVTANAEARGGAIYNQDDIQITDSTISGNQATASTVGNNTQAQATSGIRSDAQFKMSGSSVSGNTASADAPATGSSSIARGALFLNGGTTGDVEQSTIAGNKGDASGANPVETGGLYVSTDTNISSSTIALNGPDTATGVDGSNITAESSTIEMINTIVADPRGGGNNCEGTPLTSDGFNDDFTPTPLAASCFATPQTTDLTSDPLLATAGLQPNGGLTQTIALQATSPVIDQGANTGLTDPNQDQRGATFLRPVDFSGLTNAGNGTDIGAFEVQQACAGFTQPTPTTACPSPPLPPPSGPTGERAAALKKCKKLKGKTKAKKRKNCIKRAKKLPV
jgi:hypothetical protein